MTAPGRGFISWVLTPLELPGMRMPHFRARASCRHGHTEHQIVGRAALLMDSAAALTPAHALRTGCSCVTGEMVIKPKDETSAHEGEIEL